MKKEPKLIALVPFKNEEYFLPTYFHNVLPIVDEVICINDGSTDNSLKIIDNINNTKEGQNKIHVYDGEDIVGEQRPGWPEISNRLKLFNLARDHGATHFVCLDADETFTNNFVQNGRDLIENLSQGESMSLRWFSLWGSTTSVRQDDQGWSGHGVFIEADDRKNGVYNQTNDGSGMHVPRVISEGKVHTLDVHHGAVLHYQFSYLNSFYLKQAWYRCSELVIKGKHLADEINIKYEGGLNSKITMLQLPEELIAGIPTPNFPNYDPQWKYENYIRSDYVDIILGWMDEYGAEYFEELDIWYIPQLYERFKSKVGRPPIPQFIIKVPHIREEFIKKTESTQ